MLSLKDREGLTVVQLMDMCWSLSTLRSYPFQISTILPRFTGLSVCPGPLPPPPSFGSTVALGSPIGFDQPLSNIEQVSLGPGYALMLTKSNLALVCGANRAGRLGIKTRLQATPALLSLQNVRHVVALDRFAIAATSGAVYSWGCGDTGVGGSDYPETVLDIVASGLAALRVHAVAYTDKSLHIWGLNNGQFGSTANGKKVTFGTLQGVVQNPTRLDVDYGPIKAVGVLDYATLVVADALHVYMGWFHAKVRLPRNVLEMRRKKKDHFENFVPLVLGKECVVTKLTCRGSSAVFLYDNGYVLAADLDASWPNSAAVRSSIDFRALWRPKRSQDRAIDVAVSDDGSIILCTASGQVFTRKAGQKKAACLQHLTNVTKVSCDPSFGLFVLIKPNMSLPLILRKNKFLRDCFGLSPLIQSEVSLDENVPFKSGPEKPDQLTSWWEGNRYKQSKEYSKVELEDLDLSQTAVEDSGNSGWRLELEKGSFIGVDAALLALRLPVLYKAVTENVHMVSESTYFISNTKEKTLCHNAGRTAILLILHFIYTGDLLQTILARSRSKGVLSTSPTALDLQYMREFGRLIKVVDFYGHFAGPSLQASFRALVEQAELEPLLDTEIRLKDGRVRVLAVLLGARSSFFKRLLFGVWNRPTSVDLTSIEKKHFDIILRYLCGTSAFELVKLDLLEDEEDCINFWLDMMDVCDELLLDDLKDHIQMVVSEAIKTENVGALLEASIQIGAHQLVRACCWYLWLDIRQFLMYTQTLKGLRTRARMVLGLYVRFFYSLNKLENANMEETVSIEEYKPSKEDLSLFSNDLDAFNKHYMETTFELLVEVGKKARSSSSSERRRKSSIKATFESRSDSRSFISSLVMKSRSVSFNESAIEDGEARTDEDFVPVSRRKKSSSRSSLGERRTSATNERGSPEALRRPLVTKKSTTGTSTTTISPKSSKPSSPNASKVELWPVLSEVKKKSEPKKKIVITKSSLVPVNLALEKEKPEVKKAGNPWKRPESQNKKESPLSWTKSKIDDGFPVLGQQNLSDIILEESLKKEERQNGSALPTRTMAEIQQEEEFNKWFEEEARRIQEEERRLQEDIKKAQELSRKGKGGRTNRGMGNRGKGRGNRGGRNIKVQ